MKGWVPNLEDPEVATAWELVALYDLRPGDEHPVRKGWFLQNELGERGEPMWYRPPSKFGVWLRRIALAIYISVMAAVIIGVIAFRL